MMKSQHCQTSFCKVAVAIVKFVIKDVKITKKCKKWIPYPNLDMCGFHLANVSSTNIPTPLPRRHGAPDILPICSSPYPPPHPNNG